MNFELPAEMDCYSHLWFAVLVQAIEDATIPVPKLRVHKHSPLCRPGCKRLAYTEEHYFHRTAIDWFFHERKSLGSFQWICSILNLEPEKIIEQVKRRRTQTRTRRRACLTRI